MCKGGCSIDYKHKRLDIYVYLEMGLLLQPRVNMLWFGNVSSVHKNLLYNGAWKSLKT